MQKRGFSLMEMMVVMLIVAIIAAATAPMINKKMIENAAGDSPWIWTSATNNSIAFNLRGNENAPAVIGAAAPPSGVKTMLHINTVADNIPLMSFSNSAAGSKVLKLSFLGDDTKKNLWLSSNNLDTDVFNSVALGVDSTASSNSVAVGSSAPMEGSVVIGAGITSMSKNSIAIGPNTKINSNNESDKKSSIAIGDTAIADDSHSIALGFNAYANNNGISIGSGYSDAKKTSSTSIYYDKIPKVESTNTAIALGNASKASAKGSIAIGNYYYVSGSGYRITEASGERSIALGNISKATNKYSVAVGVESSSTEESSVAVGFKANSKGSNSVAMGTTAKAEKSDSIAIGNNANAAGINSIAIGSNYTYINSSNSSRTIYDTKAQTQYSIAIGTGADASGSHSIALGKEAIAEHTGSSAIGFNAKTTASNQIVLGQPGATVYIPGNLRVNGDVELAVGTSSRIKVRLGQGHSGTEGTKEFRYLVRGKFEDGHAANVYLGKDATSVGLPSDRRLKNVGEVFKAGLEEVKKLEVFNYTYKKDPNQTPRVGVMAQDLEKIFPKAVFKGDDGFLRIRMEDMFYALVNAVKELDAKIVALVEDVKTAVADITDLKIKSAEYEKTIAELVEQNKAQAKALKDLEKRLAKLEKKAKKTEVIEEEVIEE